MYGISSLDRGVCFGRGRTSSCSVFVSAAGLSGVVLWTIKWTVALGACEQSSQLPGRAPGAKRCLGLGGWQVAWGIRG